MIHKESGYELLSRKLEHSYILLHDLLVVKSLRLVSCYKKQKLSKLFRVINCGWLFQQSLQEEVPTPGYFSQRQLKKNFNVYTILNPSSQEKLEEN